MDYLTIDHFDAIADQIALLIAYVDNLNRLLHFTVVVIFPLVAICVLVYLFLGYFTKSY